MKFKRGFTLIELLVVVLIVGILAAIAIPAYTNYLVRSRRADAKTALEQVRAAQEMWRAEKGSYAHVGGADGARTALQNTMGAPATEIGRYYTWSFTSVSGTAFIATATPHGSQSSDGALTIDQNGTKLPADKWAK